jgi:hypothetical protein
MKTLLARFGLVLALAVLCVATASGVFAQATPSAGGGMAGMDMSGGDHPAHIHNGTCTELGEVVYPLSNISAAAMNNGTPMAAGGSMVGASDATPVLSSVTTIQAKLSDITSGQFALNVHESAANIGNYVACGNVGGTMIGDSDLLIGINELNGSGLSGVASLHDNGDGTTTVYVYLTQSGGMATPEATPAS